jgi:transposase-like protein/DDE family transposase
MAKIGGALSFARQEFGHAELGDQRRTRALVRLAAGLARSPAGRISQVFRSVALRERAYRFVENGAVQASALVVALARAVAARINALPMAYAVVDGSSLSLADPRGRKDFGQVGNHRSGARGLKVITAYALGLTGVPLGVLWQTYWARPKRTRRAQKSTDNRCRSVRAKETQRWLDVIRSAASQVVSRKLWYLVDREGDSRVLLQELAALGARFTVRSSWNRLLVAGGRGRSRYLRPVMAKAPVIATYAIDVPAGPARQARTANMRVRAARVRLHLKDRWLKTSAELELNVAWAVEVNTTPRGEKPLDWMLLTNAPVDTAKDVLAVVRSYQVRWRIEDFHKTWKSGRCNVEDTQLHSMHAATIFAVMHAAVAARAERLKHLGRTTPDQPAATELSPAEREAVAALAYEMLNEPLAPGGRRQSKLVPPDPETMTIGDAVTWIARLGGYTGKSSGGPPGSIVIGRGLQDVIVAARALSASKSRKGR